MRVSEKIKLFFTDYYHLFFKDASRNYLRLQQCLPDENGDVTCSVSFSSYTELKKYQKKLRTATVSLASAIAMVAVAFIVAPYVMNPNRSSASNYSWTQLDWGTETAGSVIAKDGTQTTYDSKHTDMSAGTEVKLTKATDRTETDDAHFSTTGTYGSNTDVFVFPGSGTLKPKRTNGALCGNTANHDGECVNGNCDTNFADTNKYCHATANSCVDFTTGLAEQENGYEKCSGTAPNTWYRSCASGTWGTPTNNPDTADDYCQGLAPGTCDTNAGTNCGGFDLLATCTSGTTGGFTNPACQNCTTGYLASSKTACHSSTSNTPVNDNDCWTSYHHYSGDNTCQSDWNGSCDSAECASGGTCTGNVCIPPWVCGDNLAHNGITYQTVLADDNKCWLKSNLGTATIAGYGSYYAFGQGSCPTGWHIPSQSDWAAVVSAEGITNLSTAANSNLRLPAAGYLNSGGTPYQQGTHGKYWSSNMRDGNYAYDLVFYSTSANASNYDVPNNQFSVRCVKNAL